jgi:arabinogalactan oligomer/maltooligosaccharide transport system substrate-binding protein
MRVLRRIMRCRLIAILLIAALLAACGSNGAPGTSSNPTIEANPSNVGPLLLWHGWSGSERQALGRLVEQYNRQQRDGRIVLQAVPLASFAAELRTAVAAGSGPHLILIPNTWIGPLAEAGVMLPLDDLLPSQETDALLPVTLAGARLRDTAGTQRLYGVPIRFDTIALYYNAANLTQPPADTATMLAVGRGLSDPEAQPPSGDWRSTCRMTTPLVTCTLSMGASSMATDGSRLAGKGARAQSNGWHGSPNCITIRAFWRAATAAFWLIAN